MKEYVGKNKLGLMIGIFAAFFHAVWALLVAIGVGQKSLDWIMPMHFLNNLYSVADFSFGIALLLIVMAFIGGYIIGWLFAALWNLLNKK